MRTHNVKSAAELKLLRMSKDEAFKSMGETFDYAMPQNWLNEFADFCEQWGNDVSYDLIRSTTVWEYPAIGSGVQSGPVTCCEEVYSAHEEWLRDETHGAPIESD